MRSLDLENRRFDGLRSRLFGGRASAQILVGALAIAAIVLAFVFRPGQAAQEIKPPAVAAKPTATVAVIVPIPTATLPPAPTKQPTAAPKERVHEVVSGDTLSQLASRYYNDANRWQAIYEANKDIIPDPNALQVGQKIRIPE